MWNELFHEVIHLVKCSKSLCVWTRHTRAYLHALLKCDTAGMHHVTVHNISYQVCFSHLKAHHVGFFLHTSCMWMLSLYDCNVISFSPAYPDAFGAPEYYWEQVPWVYQVLHEENVPHFRSVPRVGCGGACFSKHHPGLTFASCPAAVVNWHWRKMELLFCCPGPCSFVMRTIPNTSQFYPLSYERFYFFNSFVYISVQFCLCTSSFIGIMVLYYKKMNWDKGILKQT